MLMVNGNYYTVFGFGFGDLFVELVIRVDSMIMRLRTWDLGLEELASIRMFSASGVALESFNHNLANGFNFNYDGMELKEI